MNNRAALSGLLSAHTCTDSCRDLASILYISPVYHTDTRPVLSCPPSQDPVPFPPVVLPRSEICHIVQEWCKVSSSDSYSEQPCAVCARLTLCTDVSRVRDTALDLSVLDRPGEYVTRAERLSFSTPVQEIAGPILCQDGVERDGDDCYLVVCKPCLAALRRHCIPRHALANGRWVGACPEVLQDLTYVEQLMIARFRHSFCVAQVSLGQRYLAANVVTFGQPVERAYKTLPPPRAEMEQILAILFVGPARPSDEDVRRVPFLMRLRHLARSIEWLAYNSESYVGVEVSAENLAQYEDGAPPVGIVHRSTSTLSDATNTASYESVPDRGVQSGDCAFIVHALTEEDLADM
ncbi:hypothetical protein OH76DRAFT_1359506, partial [Lentinus brumalis]